jgi:hypothetical protein
VPRLLDWKADVSHRMNKPAQEGSSHPGWWNWQGINLVAPTAHEPILLLAEGKLTLGMWVDEDADLYPYWIDIGSICSRGDRFAT